MDPAPETGDQWDDATVADYDDSLGTDENRDYLEEAANAALLRDESELDDALAGPCQAVDTLTGDHCYLNTGHEGAHQSAVVASVLGAQPDDPEPTLDDYRDLIVEFADRRAGLARQVEAAQTTARMWKDANDAWRQRARTAERRLYDMRLERDDLVARLNAADPFRGLPGCDPYVAQAAPTEPVRPLAVVREAGPLRPSTSGRDQAVGESREDYDLRGEL